MSILKRIRKSEALTAWMFLIPGLFLLCVFVFYPIIFSVPLAFTNYSVIDKTKFIGFDNFKRAFNDPDFIVAIINSLKYIIIVPIIQVLSIFMAILINSNVKGIKIFRVTFYIPVVTSMVAVAIIWGWLFSPDGMVNYIFLSLGLIHSKISWLSQSQTALWCTMFVTLWKGLGYYMMIYLAGLQSVPKELEEAATVDGATNFQKIRLITMPLLKPYIFFCSLMSLMAAIRVFDEVFVLTNGGPGNATLTTSLFIYNKGFINFDFGYAAAVGLLVSIIIMILSIVAFIFNKKGGVNPY